MERNGTGTFTDFHHWYCVNNKMGFGSCVCVCVSCIEGIDGPICAVSPLPHFFMPNESHILVVMLLMWPFLS